MKYYLVEAELISGEFGQMFRVAFAVEDNKDIDGRLHEYFVNYYGDKSLLEADEGIDQTTYLYHGGQVGVKYHGYTEISIGDFEVFKKYAMSA